MKIKGHSPIRHTGGTQAAAVLPPGFLPQDLARRLARRVGMMDVAGWQLSRKGEFIAESSCAARGNVEQFGHVLPSMIKTWSFFTHGH